MADQSALKILELHKPYLREHIHHSKCTFIAHSLKVEGIISQEDYHLIDTSEDSVKTDKLIDCVVKFKEDKRAFASFLNALPKGLDYVRAYLQHGKVYISKREEMYKHVVGISMRVLVEKLSGEELVNFLDFDRHTREMIQAKPTNMEKTFMMLDELNKRPNGITGLVKELETGTHGDMSHVIQFLNGYENKEDKKIHFETFLIICKNYCEISKCLEPNDILFHMSLEESFKESTANLDPRESRVEALMTYLVNKPSGWFKTFIQALHDAEKDYSALIATLENTDVEKEIHSEDISGCSSNQSVEMSSISEHGIGPMDQAIPDCQVVENPSCQPENQNSETAMSGVVESPSIPPADQSMETTSCPAENTVASRVEPIGQESTENYFPERASSSNETPVDNLNIEAEQNSSVQHENQTEGSPSGLPELKLRDYQERLAAPGLKGENSMICSSTGSGKTFVALKICKNHLETTENPKVVFLVPRVALVAQQHKLFKSYLGDAPELLHCVTGETSSKFPVFRSIQKYKVTFMTPQVLLNILKDELMNITDFTLLIIDECHHALKNDPCNNIMKIYLDLRLTQENPALPQIIGMTASPGMGVAKRVKQAEDNIKALLANLDITTAPVPVRIKQEDAKEAVIIVSRSPQDKFRQSIHKSMDDIQQLVETEISRNTNALVGKKIEYDLKSRQGSQDYEAWVVTLRNRSKPLDEGDLSYKLMMYAEALLFYNTALVLNDHVRSTDAEDQLYRDMDKIRSEHPVCKRLYAIYEKHKEVPLNAINPLLSKLTGVLIEEFGKKPSSLCIIFVKTRSIANYLIVYMKEDQKLTNLKLNPKMLTGAGARGELGGMTKPDQEHTLEQFRESKCKVIVATSVGEEGLDIKACNLVINYNYSTNEVGHIQRKGRGRAEDSKTVMLAYDDSGHVAKERENKIRVELIDELLETIQRTDPVTLKKEIREIQTERKKLRDFEEKQRKLKQQREKGKSNKGFTMLCLWCKRKVTDSTQLRHINNQHRVIIDPTLAAKAELKIESDVTKWKKMKNDDEVVVGKFFCKNRECRCHWGYRMRHLSSPVYVPRVDSFVFTTDTGFRDTFKKWSLVPFAIQEISWADIERLLPSNDAAEEEDENTYE